MKNRVINFKDEKIENCYDAQMFVIHLPDNWLDLTLQEQQDWYQKVKSFISMSQNKNIILRIQSNCKEELDFYEQLQIISKVAEQTITEESTNKEYLYIPTWFKDHVFSSIDIQKKLGNFKNKFEKLQIELYYNDEVLERLVE